MTNKPNHLASASGSIQEARRLIISHLQESKVNESNAEEFMELLDLHKRLGATRLSLEGMSLRSGVK